LYQVRLVSNRAKNYWLRTGLEHASGCLRVLDLGCGRGGDLFKYHHAGIAHYHGLDLDGEALHEAQSRYRQLRARYRRTFSARWTQGRMEDAVFLLRNEPHRFDLLSCQLALHYVSESLRHVLLSWDQLLAPGGALVVSLLRFPHDLDELCGPHFRLQRQGEDRLLCRLGPAGSREWQEPLISVHELRRALEGLGYRPLQSRSFLSLAEQEGLLPGVASHQLSAADRSLLRLYEGHVFLKSG